MEIQIAPSLLAADYANLASEVRRIESAGAQILHLDIMDGHFVPNLSFGAAVVSALRPFTKMIFDVHLMVSEPEKFIPLFVDAGADEITVHLEIADADSRLNKIFAEIRRHGKKVGLSLNPDTPTAKLRDYVEQTDLILLMSVFPGAGGQKFIPDSPERLRQIREITGAKNVVRSIDGGITIANAKEIRDAGATRLVAGTAVFGAPNARQAIAALRGGTTS